MSDPAVPQLLDPRQRDGLGRLLEAVLPYPVIPAGPSVGDTVRYVQRRLEHEDRALLGPLEVLLEEAAGRETAWVAEAAADPEAPHHDLFVVLRGWAWDGFLADPRYGVNRGGLGWAHLGWAGPPRRRERP